MPTHFTSPSTLNGYRVVRRQTYRNRPGRGAVSTAPLHLSSVWWSQSMHEVGRIYVQRGGHFEDVVQRQVASPALDLPQERPVHIAIGGELLLRLAKFKTTLADASAELGSGR
jgi:hypothetical protein